MAQTVSGAAITALTGGGVVGAKDCFHGQ
jgi:hypothetical protein